MDLKTLMAAMKATANPKPVAVEVPGWGKVFVKRLTVAEVDEQAKDTADKSDKNRIARGACRVLCDENGAALFSPDNPEHVALLAAQPWDLLRKVTAAASPDEGKA